MTGLASALPGIALPIVQAPIGNAATPALAAAVANAGGLGTLALSWSDGTAIRRLVQGTAALTARPFGANFVLAWDQRDRIDAALAAGVRIVSTAFGDPAPYAPAVHAAGGRLIHMVGSPGDAAAAVAAGADVLVAQGSEAGGHLSGSLPLRVLLARLRAEFPGLPLLAAGGLADAHDVAAVRTAGAAGAWLGTRFVCASESAAADLYQQAVIAAGPDDTVVTTLYSRGWPDAPHRVLRNSTLRAFEREGKPVDDGVAVARSAGGTDIPRYAYALPTRSMTGDLEAMALYAGQGAAAIGDVRPAAELVRWLADGWTDE